MRAMMKTANFTQERKNGLWAECANTATELSNMISHRNSTPHRIFYGHDPKFTGNLHTFGEFAVIKKASPIQSKLKDKGVKVMFLGYARDHGSDVFRFWKMDTNKVVLSRDVTWLSTMPEMEEKQEKIDPTFERKDVLEEEGDKKTIEKPYLNESLPSQELEGELIDQDDDEEDELPREEYQIKTRSATQAAVKFPRELRNLNTFYNPIASTENELTEFIFLSMGLDQGEPASFEEAWEHPDPNERAGWRKAIEKELTDMHVKRQIWTPTKIQDIPQNRRLIGSKWVFKKKKNGVFRARLCALGYSQIPGVDYTENFARVVNDVTLRLVLLKWLMNPGWKAQVYDVETAFLYGDLEEPVYMRIPKGLDHFVDDLQPQVNCLLLKKAMYGLVQAARQWWKKFICMLSDEFHFTRSHADACVLF
jgi:hypothetical protein